MSWSSIARSQGGTICRRQLLDAGVSASQIGRMVRSGGLIRQLPGVYLGLPVTTRIDSLLDHLTTLRFGEAATLADWALQRRWLTPVDVSRRLEEYSGRPGVAILRRIAAQLGDGAAAESERTLHRLLRRAEVNGWVPNYRLPVAGRIYVVDVAFPAARLAVEIDGLAYHSDAERFQGDRHRQNDLVGAGWTVLARSA